METGNEIVDSTGNMIVFFRRLADDLENHVMNPLDIMKAGQMYTYWKYKTDPQSSTMSDEDVQKYIMTGWYIYQHYNSINSNPNDAS